MATRSLWQLTNDLLLPSVLSYLDSDNEDAYSLWLVIAEARDVPNIEDSLLLFPTRKPLSIQRAQLLAIMHSCWVASYRLLSCKKDSWFTIDKSTQDVISREVENACGSLHSHPYRLLAMSSSLPRHLATSSTIKRAAARGRLDVVVWLHHVLPKYDQDGCLQLAAENGHHEVVSWLLDRPHEIVQPIIKCQDDPALGVIAWRCQRTQSQSDYFYVMSTRYKVFLRRGCPGEIGQATTCTGARLGDVAAKYGDMEYVRRLISHPLLSASFSERAVFDAAAGGHWDVVRYLLEHHPDVANANCIFKLRGSRHIITKLLVREFWYDRDMLRMRSTSRYCCWDYHENRRIADAKHIQNVFVDAIRHGFTDLTKCLIVDFSFEMDKLLKTSAEVAAEKGQLNVIQWLLHHCPKKINSSEVFIRALRHGHVEIAKWLATEGFLQRQYLSLMEFWAKKNRDDETLRWVLEASSSDLVWLDNSYIPLGIIDAIAAGDAVLIEWLVETHKEEVTRAHVERAIKSENTQLAKWIVRVYNQKCFDDNVAFLRASAKSGKVGLVRFFVEEIGVWDPEAFQVATTWGKVDVAKFLYDIALKQPRSMHSPPSGWRPVILEHWRSNRFDSAELLLSCGFDHGFLSAKFIHRAFCIEDPATKHGDEDEMTSLSEEHQIRRTVALMIKQYDPSFVRTIEWLPLWAVRVGRLDCLQRLLEIGHPGVLAPKTMGAVTRETKDEAMVKWLVEQRNCLFTSRVVEWGVRFDKRLFLQWAFRKFIVIPVQSGEPLHPLQLKLREKAKQAAKRYGRAGILEALSSWTAERGHLGVRRTYHF